MPEYHLLRVFTAGDGSGGNPLAVFANGAEVAAHDRQATAAALGYSETVFVDDPETGAAQIFTPAVEIPFAGHPLVGTAWLLASRGHRVNVLRPPAGEVPARAEHDRAFVAARPEWAPPYEWKQLASPSEVEALAGPPENHDLFGVYAWMGDSTVRARVFPRRLGIAEDEATGAAAVRLGSVLDRPITIHQGRGSTIEVRPRDDGMIEIGGQVVLDKLRAFPASSLMHDLDA